MGIILTYGNFKNWLFPDPDNKGEGRYRISYLVERGETRQGRAEIGLNLALLKESSHKEARFTGNLLQCVHFNIKI